MITLWIDVFMYSLSLIGRGSCCFRPPPPGATLERLQPRGRGAQLCVGGCGITRAFLLPYATRPSLDTPIPASRSEEGCGHAGVASPATHRRAPRSSVVDRGHRRALGGSQRRPAGQRPTVVGATQRDPGQAAAIRLRAKRHRGRAHTVSGALSNCARGKGVKTIVHVQKFKKARLVDCL